MDGVADVAGGVTARRSKARGARAVGLTVSAETRKQILAEASRPGAVVSEVARRWGVSPQRVFGWRRQADEERHAVVAADTPAFVPIVSMTSFAASDPAAQPCRAVARIEVRLAGAELRIAPDTDAALLTMVLRAIRASAA